jgi:hypothetical protein
MCIPTVSLINLHGMDSRECLCTDNKDYSVFEVHYKITEELVIGVTCKCLRHITEFVNGPNYTVDTLMGGKSPIGFFICKSHAIFKDGKILCYHCRNYIGKLRGLCEHDCHPNIIYL